MNIDGYYIHTLNPFLVRFWGEFGIRWYGLSYLAGFLLGYAAILWISKRGRILLRPELVGDFVFTVALGCIVGGRLGYVFFYSPELLVTFFPEVPFWGVLAINHGGMASHGGMIGIAVSCWLFGRKRSIPIPHLFDLTILGATLGIFLGRIANFINGELLGRPCIATKAWCVKFPQEMLLWGRDQLETLAPLVQYVGVSPGRWSEILQEPTLDRAYSIVSLLIMRIQDGGVRLTHAVAPLLTPRYPSQLYASLLEGLLLFIILFWVWRKPRKPGVVTAIFFILYALGRIFDEQYRSPDIQIGFQLWGLTRGQWLSVGLLIIGLICLGWWTRRPAVRYGGWKIDKDGVESSSAHIS